MNDPQIIVGAFTKCEPPLVCHFVQRRFAKLEGGEKEIRDSATFSLPSSVVVNLFFPFPIQREEADEKERKEQESYTPLELGCD